MLGGILAKMGPQDTTPVSKYVMLLKKFVGKINFLLPLNLH